MILILKIEPVAICSIDWENQIKNMKSELKAEIEAEMKIEMESKMFEINCNLEKLNYENDLRIMVDYYKAITSDFFQSSNPHISFNELKDTIDQEREQIVKLHNINHYKLELYNSNDFFIKSIKECVMHKKIQSYFVDNLKINFNYFTFFNAASFISERNNCSHFKFPPKKDAKKFMSNIIELLEKTKKNLNLNKDFKECLLMTLEATNSIYIK